MERNLHKNTPTIIPPSHQMEYRQQHEPHSTTRARTRRWLQRASASKTLHTHISATHSTHYRTTRKHIGAKTLKNTQIINLFSFNKTPSIERLAMLSRTQNRKGTSPAPNNTLYQAERIHYSSLRNTLPGVLEYIPHVNAKLCARQHNALPEAEE